MKVISITRNMPKKINNLPPFIKWNNADKIIPKIHESTAWPKDHSRKVLVYAAFSDYRTGKVRPGTWECRFGWYLEYGTWMVEGMAGSLEVSYWAYLKIPNKNLNKNKYNGKK